MPTIRLRKLTKARGLNIIIHPKRECVTALRKTGKPLSQPSAKENLLVWMGTSAEREI
jgi:hypothetical protein